MRLSPSVALIASLALFSAAIPALAAPGEAAAVAAHCGQPTADNVGTSEVDGLPQRTLTYGNLRLNFQPASTNGTSTPESGLWSFTTAWKGHLPYTAREVSKTMPCFGDALTETQTAYQASLATMDPAIAAQSIAPKHGAFNIANLWFILLLAGIIAIFAVAIPRRRKVVLGPDPTVRPYRRPSLKFITRRRPARTIVPERP